MTIKTTTVSLSEIEATEGAPLNADYYINRKPGETYDQFLLRRKIGREVTAIQRQLGHLSRRLGRLSDLVNDEGEGKS